MAKLLGREERLEDLLVVFGGNARPRVRNLEADVRSGVRPRLHGREGLVHHVRRRQRQLPAVGHRVAGVDAEIDHDLVELRGVAFHGPEVGREAGDDLA